MRDEVVVHGEFTTGNYWRIGSTSHRVASSRPTTSPTSSTPTSPMPPSARSTQQSLTNISLTLLHSKTSPPNVTEETSFSHKSSLPNSTDNSSTTSPASVRGSFDICPVAPIQKSAQRFEKRNLPGNEVPQGPKQPEVLESNDIENCTYC